MVFKSKSIITPNKLRLVFWWSLLLFNEIDILFKITLYKKVEYLVLNKSIVKNYTLNIYLQFLNYIKSLSYRLLTLVSATNRVVPSAHRRIWIKCKYVLF